MAQKIDNTLLLLRYALGFRDWESAVKSAKLDWARGGFQTLFYNTAASVWSKTSPIDNSYTDDEIQTLPAAASLRRWFTGTRPKPKSLPGILHTLNTILVQREEKGAQFVFPGAARVPHIPTGFRLDKFHLEMETRVLAKEIGVDIEDFDAWRAEAQSHAPKGKVNAQLNEVRGHAGFYFVYRLSTFEPNFLQRTVMVIREEADKDKLALYMIGKSARVWRGALVVGRSTLSALIERSSEFHGRQVNALSLTYDHEDLNYENDIFAGFRTRVISQSESHMQSYRVIVAKQAEHANLVDEDFNDSAAVERLGLMCRSAEPETENDLRWHEALQVTTTLTSRNRKFEPNPAFNLFALPDLSRLPKKKRAKKR